ncbi:undecaprenyl-phosphate alpha-N-acetylglucosaminyl 1-phosphate transferase [Bacillus sp. V3-13]|uniref:glycosyltransferase family 4 protein n=1 Tax=Bacillus sp. V3-13 TaxID=2053728 RepID=UPI000C794E9C|nr:MraY family glycosyltransferase [Bacillus sp. V3-13]PLR78276.1 undecaprenyl-phosphate alpha-N-acetylglucosaminyl 1-phosphate transferase [Bacillus sp. V3-13]
MMYFTVVLCFTISIIITPFIKKFAYKVGATDCPNGRKIHDTLMPRLGGLAIYISFVIGLIISQPVNPYSSFIFGGSIIVVMTGILDDIFTLSAKLKLIGQLIAAALVVIVGGLQVEIINLPFGGGQIELSFLSIPLTILWIVGMTNAINLIDGLDGLAAGVCCIALLTISGMAFIMGDLFVLTTGMILLASTLGFLFHNFHPAKIFMGDTGALFLGYMISVLALLGFKNVTFISFVVPVIILGVPISDTVFAIIRRVVNKKPLSSPDKSHLHHCLLRLGFSHRQTVFLIYAMAAFFGIVAVIFSQANLWGAFLLLVILLFLVELGAEKIGLMGKNYRPLLKIGHIIRYFYKKKRYTP